eukprot:symbB.v1.2.034760.t1/scaffold4498.1/size38904/1
MSAWETGAQSEPQKRLSVKLSVKEQPLVLPPTGPHAGSSAKSKRCKAQPKTAASRTEKSNKSAGSGRVPQLSFERFRRNKEREQQSAPVYDIRSARSGVLQSLRLGELPEEVLESIEEKRTLQVNAFLSDEANILLSSSFACFAG